jgi:hypothetical protein
MAAKAVFGLPLAMSLLAKAEMAATSSPRLIDPSS